MSAAPDLFEHLATPLLRVDVDGRIRAANPAAAGWLGLGQRRLVGQPLALLEVEPDSLGTLLDRVSPDSDALRVRHVALRGGSDEPRFADVWIGAHAGDVLLELHPVAEFPGPDPLSALPAAMHAALKGLAHEVKNPLAGLQGAAQLLARRVDDPDARRYIEVIRAEAARLAALVGRLLDPGAPQQAAPVNIHQVLERVRTLAEAEAGWAVQLERDYDPSLPELLGDADLLTQALWNLVRNALESGAGHVRLRTRPELGARIGDRVLRRALRVEVSDDGRGVPEDLAERIFLPLVSGRAEGSGLGLSQAQQAARAHGGTLGYRSRPGHTVFTLLLPLPDEVPADAA